MTWLCQLRDLYRLSIGGPQESHKRKEGFDDQGQHDVRGWGIMCVQQMVVSGYKDRYGCEAG